MSRAWEPNAIGSVVPPFGGGGGGGGGGITQLTQDVLAGPGSGSQPATVVGLQGNPVSNAAPVAGQALVWNGAQWAPATVPQSPFYPAIDANTILAWDFTGTAASIPNLGTAGAGADMVTIGGAVVRDVPGPVNTGVGVWGTSANGQVYTAQGVGAALGSGNFVNDISIVTFIDLTATPDSGGLYEVIRKGYQSGVWNPPYGIAIYWNGGSLVAQCVVSDPSVGALARSLSAPPGNVPAGAYGFRPGLHMVGYTYDGTVARLYFDGVELASTNFGAPASLLMGVAGDEGPWNVGTPYAGAIFGLRGVVYAARVHNVVKNAAWMSQAWRDANGWP